SVNAAGTLRGTGSTDAAIASTGGTIAPGVGGVGTFSTGSVSLDGSSAFSFDTSGPGSDLLQVAGTVALNGAFNPNAISTPADDTITVIDNDGTADATTGQFTGIADGGTVMLGTREYQLFYNGGDGNDVVLVSTDTSDVTISATTDAAESSTAGQFTVHLSSARSTDTVVAYTATGTAAEGADYTTLGGQVTILAGQTSATIDISVIDDPFLESTETVIVTLDSIVSGFVGVSVGTADSATISLSDNDTATADLSVSTHGVEGGVDIVFTVTLSQENQTGAPITFSIVDLATGSATGGVDYTLILPGATISVADGESTGTFTVS
ncbi:MAG: hypothetical protein KDM64_19030, partial [Verrucomicrobiae bacterium]|nr:hypothetical protein [Verrucomicrobiae bacterium]